VNHLVMMIKKKLLMLALAAPIAQLEAMEPSNTLHLRAHRTEVVNLGNNEVTSLESHPEKDQLAYCYSCSEKKNNVHVWQSTHPEYAIELVGHTDTVGAVTYCPGADQSGAALLASGSADTTIKLWDIEHKSPIVTLSGHEKAVVALAYTRAHQLLASGSKDTTIRLWNLTTKEALLTLKGHTESVTSLAHIPESRLVSVSGDTTVKEWDLVTGKCLFELELAPCEEALFSCQDIPNHVACHPDGNLIAVACECNDVQLFDNRTSKLTALLTGHENELSMSAFDPRGTYLAAADHSGMIKYWDIRSNSVHLDSKVSDLPVDVITYNAQGTTMYCAAKIFDAYTRSRGNATTSIVKLSTPEHVEQKNYMRCLIQ